MGADTFRLVVLDRTSDVILSASSPLTHVEAMAAFDATVSSGSTHRVRVQSEAAFLQACAARRNRMAVA